MATSSGERALQIVNKITTDRKNSNLILELEDLLTDDNTDVIPVMKAVVTLFSHFLKTKEMSISPDEKEESPQVKYKQWLCQRYIDFQNHLRDLIVNGEEDVQISAIDCVMELIRVEGLYPLENISENTWYFPKSFFKALISCLINEDCDMSCVILHFKSYLKDDIKLYVLKTLNGLLNENTKKSDIQLLNTFTLLTKIHYPDSIDESSSSCNSFICGEDGPKFVLKKKVFSREFTQVWLQFVKCKMSNILLKKLMNYLPKKVLPHLNDPLLLTDFLTDSYNAGGIISLLALNGVFYLMQNYNLEYPDFYRKLYSLFTVEVVTSTYRSTFFFLSDLFLSSTHLPSYLVAAFTKRLCRLMLMVPPYVAVIMEQFVGNLLIRHPFLEFLIHNPGKEDLSSDPYDFETSDPAACNAMESSLWELKALQNHWYSKVSQKADFINSALPRIEWDMSDIIHTTFDDMVTKELSMTSTVPLSYCKPSGFFNGGEDRMNDMWTL